MTTANASDGLLKQLYETAFSKEEQIPWDDFVRLVDEIVGELRKYWTWDKQ